MPGEQIGSAFVTIGLDTKGLESGLNAAKSSVESATKDMGGMGSKISEGLRAGFSKDAGNFSKVGHELGNNLTQGLEQRFGALGGVAGSMASALGPIGVAGLAAGAAIAGGFALAINAAKTWEAGMAGVAKTTGLAGDDLKGLSDELLSMSTKMPTAAADLQAIAGVAGSLGVAKQDIAGFTEVASQMAVGFEMSAEVAATSAAKILTSFGKPIDASNMKALGNVVNSMGDNFAATEPQVLDFINRASFLNTTMGQSIPQVAALGTTLVSVGLEAEVAATGIKSALNMGLSETSKTGGIVNWAKLMGISIDELKGKLSTDLGGTMVETANKIAAMEDPVARFQTAVALFGSEGAPAVLKLAGQTDNLKKALSTANSEWTDGSSLMKTYETQSGTLNSRFAILSNTLNMIGVSVGTPMLPWVSGAVNALQQLIVAGFNAGKAIVSIVQNSNAFKAFESAIGNIGNVVSTTFGNFVSLVKPAWDALGGGSAVMSVLQAAFNALTAPITLVFSALSTVVGALGKVASAISPVASALGGALGTAIKTASAYIKAFVEAFSNLGPIKSFQSAIQGAADIAGKVWDGLSTAIPQAFTSAFEAVKTLITGFVSWVGDALGVGDIGNKITTGIKNSLGEGITGWIGSISGRANELLGAGEEIAKPVATGVKTDEELQKAAAEALQTPEALAAAEKAGGVIADKTLSGFATQAKLSGLGDEAMLAMINGQSAGDSKIKEAVFSLYGKTIRYWYDAAEKYPISNLAIDGVNVYSKAGIQTPAQILALLGLPQPEKIEETAKMEGNKAKAAILSVKEAAKSAMGKGIFDISPALANIDSFSAQLSARFKGLVSNIGKEIESLGNAPAYEKTRAIWTREGQALIDALAEPISLQGFAKVKSALTGISDWTATWASVYGGTAEDAANEYKEKLLSGIGDMGLFVKTEMTRIGDEAKSAFEDGLLTDGEQTLLLALKPQLEFLRDNFPEYFKEAGGEATLALIAEVEAGDIPGAFAAIGKEAGEEFSANLLGGAQMDISIKALIVDPEKTKKLITDPIRYAYNEAIPEMTKYFDEVSGLVMSGADPVAVYENYIAPLEKIKGYVPGFVMELSRLLGEGKISYQQFFKLYEINAAYATGANDKLSKSTNTAASSMQKATGHTATFTHACNALGTSAEFNTGKLTSMGLAISPLEQISGKGIYVKFSPAEVVAERAYNSLSRGAEAVKIGTDYMGRKWAVIGEVAQQQWLQMGGKLINDGTSAGVAFKAPVVSAANTVQSALSTGASALTSAAASLMSKYGYTPYSIPTSKTSSTSPTSTTTTSKKYGTTSWGTPLHSDDFASWGKYATGTMTSGPQLAMIGEDGAANPEFVIPTKKKRWDLLFAAMRSYGIPGFAEGTSTGSATEDAIDADKMTAYFGIVGLASMSKQVQKIITNLKDFFRISWGIVKAEGSTYWKQINTLLTTEITSIRDTGWQAAIDIRNTWLATSAAIMEDAKAKWASYWPSIEPSISNLKDSIISSFEQAGEGAKYAIDSMVMNSEAAINAFQLKWSEIWDQLVTDMNDAQTKISEGVAVIADALKSISVNVNISGGGGGYGGGGGGSGSGGFPGDWDFGGGGDWLAPTGDWSDWGGTTYNVNTGGGGCNMGGSGCSVNGYQDGCTGMVINPLKYTSPSGVTQYINPMNYNSGAGLSSGGSAYSGSPSGYSLPALFAAKGALVEQPSKVILAEAGPELVLPTKLTRMFTSLADMGFGAAGGRSSEKIIIEDHTEHHWYMDSKEVTNQVMKTVQKRLQLRGAVPAR